MREKIFNIIQIGDKSNRISRAFDIFITITIVSNILVTFLQTFEELDFLSGFFFVVEVITLFIFCVEYVLPHLDGGSFISGNAQMPRQTALYGVF